MLHLPPSPTIDDARIPLPSFLTQYPVATVNYRWDMFEDRVEGATSYESGRAHAWPTPVHDVGFSYAWLSENLRPLGSGRQAVYAYGSYLGASLATSLALTECHSHTPFAVRGLIAYNGIYNWSMFLPDHKVNRPLKRGVLGPGPIKFGSEHMQSLWEQLPALFGQPGALLDCFASPSLFFHNPGILDPMSFYTSTEEKLAIDALSGSSDVLILPMKPPRKSHLIFPPRSSTLKIPEALLLHDSLPRSARTKGRQPKTVANKTVGSNSFAGQAAELAELMWRSVDVVELKERSKWDEEMEVWADEAKRRVQLADVGAEQEDLALKPAGVDVIERWLGERL